jgi:hypothetical protein
MTHLPLVAEPAKKGINRRLISEHRLESFAPLKITTLTTMGDERYGYG